MRWGGVDNRSEKALTGRPAWGGGCGGRDQAARSEGRTHQERFVLCIHPHPPLLHRPHPSTQSLANLVWALALSMRGVQSRLCYPCRTLVSTPVRGLDR